MRRCLCLFRWIQAANRKHANATIILEDGSIVTQSLATLIVPPFFKRTQERFFCAEAALRNIHKSLDSKGRTKENEVLPNFSENGSDQFRLSHSDNRSNSRVVDGTGNIECINEKNIWNHPVGQIKNAGVYSNTECTSPMMRIDQNNMPTAIDVCQRKLDDDASADKSVEDYGDQASSGAPANKNIQYHGVEPSCDATANRVHNYGVEPCHGNELDSDTPCKSQVTAICNILRNGPWSARVQSLLEPFVKTLSCSLVARVINSVPDIEISRNFFYWAEQQNEYKHSTFTYNALLLKLGTAKDFVNMWETLDEMCRKSCMVNNATFTIIIQAYGKAGLLDECWRTVHRASNYGMKADVRLYTALLGALFAAAKVDKAKQLFTRMLRINRTLDIRSWSTAIHGFCKNGKMQDAQVYLDQMLSDGCKPDVFIYNAMILGYSELNCPEKALLYYDKMHTEGCKSDLYTYNAVIGLYCSLNKFDEADMLFSNMADAGYEPNQVTYNTYLSGLLKVAKVVEAEEFFKRMQKERKVDQASYRIYTSYLRRSNDLNRLVSLSKEMFSRYGNNNVEICNAILQHHCDSGDLNKAIEYFHQELVNLTAPDEFSYALLINVFCRSANFDAARSLLSKMSDMGYKPTDQNYNPLIIGLCKTSRQEEALQLFLEMREKRIDPSPASCEHLLIAVSKAGMADAVISVCKHITEKHHFIKESTVLLFVKCLNKCNRLQDAKKLLGALQHSGCLSKRRRYKCVFQAILNGDVKEVERFFSNPLGLVVPNRISYKLRIEGCCKKNKIDEAKLLLSEMEELGCTPNASCYGPVISGLCRVGRQRESFDLFEQMVGRGIYCSVISSNLMKRLCEVQMVEEILKLGKHIILKGLTVQRTSITFLIEQENRIDGSDELLQLLNDLKQNNCIIPTT